MRLHRTPALVTALCFLLSTVVCIRLRASQAPQTQGSAAPSGTAIPPGANLKDPAILLPLATTANSIADLRTPWHIKASYEISLPDGAITDIGTFEEWHLAPDRWKRSYTSDQFKQTEYTTPEGHSYETDAGAAPWPQSLVPQELTNPMPEERDTTEIEPEVRDLNLKVSKLTCTMLSSPLKRGRWPLGLFPTYCFDPNSIMLRAEVFDGGIQAIRNQMALFENTFMPRDISLSDEGKPFLHIRLESLSSMSAAEAAAIVWPPQKNPGVPDQVEIASGVMSGNKIGGPAPNYPVNARQGRIQGTVVLKARIGTDGRIHHLRVVSSPDESLSISSVAAVERWVYKPYTLKGEPVAVETTVNVIYRLGL